jgi:hypothetical protein
MRTIRIIEHISLDGVIQGPGGPEEDPANGFNHGGWAFPHHDERRAARPSTRHKGRGRGRGSTSCWAADL